MATSDFINVDDNGNDSDATFFSLNNEEPPTVSEKQTQCHVYHHGLLPYDEKIRTNFPQFLAHTLI